MLLKSNWLIMLFLDPCASNPCQNMGKCKHDSETGFRCINCAAGYYGLMCEQGISNLKKKLNVIQFT